MDVNYNFNAIKGGFFGTRTVETLSGNAVVRPWTMTWSGWITGETAVMNLFMQYYYTMAVSVDGAPFVQVPGVSLGGGNYAFTLFASLLHEPHFVQIAPGTNVAGFAGIYTSDTPPVWPIVVSSASTPAVEGLCTSAAIAWNPLDPAFPGTTALLGAPADCQPWRAQAVYGVNSRIASNGLIFAPKDTGNFPRMAGTDPAQVPTAEAYYAGGDNMVSWNYEGLASAIFPRLHYNPNPDASDPTLVQQIVGFPKGQIGDAGNGGAATLFRGKASEVWARVSSNYWTVAATGGTANLCWWHTGSVTKGTAGSSVLDRAQGEGPLADYTAVALEAGHSMPAGFSLSRTNSSITIAWSGATEAGLHVLPIVVTTAIGNLYFTAVFIVRESASAPYFGGPYQQSLVAGTPINVRLAPSNLNNTITDYAATDLPPGLSINATTGYLSGTPTTPGHYRATITANGAPGAVVSINFTVTAAGAPAFPDLDKSIGKPGVILTTAKIIGRPYVGYQVRATNAPTSFAVGVGGDALPPGLTLDTATGWIRGTPTTAGKYEVEIIATNGAGSSSCKVSLQVVTRAQWNGGLFETVDRWFNSQICWSASGRQVSDAPFRYGSTQQTKTANGTVSGRVTAFDPFQQGNVTQPVWVMLANDIDPTVENTFMVYDHVNALDGIMLRLPGGTPTMVPLKTETSIQFGDSVTSGFSPTTEGAFLAAEFNIATMQCGVAAEKLRTAIQRVRPSITGFNQSGHVINYALSAFGRNDAGKRPDWVNGQSVTLHTGVEAGGNNWVTAMQPFPATITSTVDPSTISPTGPRGDEGGTIGADGIPWYAVDFAFVQASIQGATWQPTVLSANIPGGTSFYRRGTIIQRNGNVYICDTTGTSVEGPTGTATGPNAITEATGTAKWRCCSASADWQANTDYPTGTIVWNDGEQYVALLGGRSSNTPPKGRNEGQASYADEGAVKWRVRSTHSVWTAGKAVGDWSRVSSDIGGGVIRYYAVYGSGTASASVQPTFTGAIGTRGYGSTGGTTAPGADGVNYSYEGDNITDYPPYTTDMVVATGGGANRGSNLLTAVRGGRTSSDATFGPAGPNWMYNNYTDGIWWANVSRRAYGSPLANPYDDLKVWLPRQNYRVWDVCFNGGRAYLCTQAGRTAVSGGPTGTDGTNPVTDGTCQWKWISWTVVGQLQTIFRDCRSLGVVLTARHPGSYGNQQGQDSLWIPGLREVCSADTPDLGQYLDANWGIDLGPNYRGEWACYLHPTPEGYAQLGSLLSRDLAERIGRRHNFAFGM